MAYRRTGLVAKVGIMHDFDREFVTGRKFTVVGITRFSQEAG